MARRGRSRFYLPNTQREARRLSQLDQRKGNVYSWACYIVEIVQRAVPLHEMEGRRCFHDFDIVVGQDPERVHSVC